MIRARIEHGDDGCGEDDQRGGDELGGRDLGKSNEPRHSNAGHTRREQKSAGPDPDVVDPRIDEDPCEREPQEREQCHAFDRSRAPSRGRADEREGNAEAREQRREIRDAQGGGEDGKRRRDVLDRLRERNEPLVRRSAYYPRGDEPVDGECGAELLRQGRRPARAPRSGLGTL